MTAQSLTLRADSVVARSGIVERGVVRVEGAMIAAVEPADGSAACGPCLEGALLLPGFIDLHTHGFAGHDFLRGGSEAREAVRLVARSGVTTCYAALGAGESFARIMETVAAAAEAVGAETGGARLAGLFLEGPYLSPAKKGAWNAAQLRLPDVRELRALIDASRATIRRVNIAPELPGALAFIRAAREAGVAVSIGHSNASYEQSLAAVEAGATIANHTFNAMSGLEHRAPGMVGATLDRDELLAEVILDGVHVHPAAARALVRAKGSARVALITDGTAMTGLDDGEYAFNGRTVVVRGGACRLEDGTLAGSVTPFDECFRNAARWLELDLAQLAAISSGNAARAMGIDGHAGAIEEGMVADLVLLDEELRVLATVVGGRVVWPA